MVFNIARLLAWGIVGALTGGLGDLLKQKLIDQADADPITASDLLPMPPPNPPLPRLLWKGLKK